MRVIAPGTLVFTNGALHIAGWTFDLEGAGYPADEETAKRLVAACVLRYVAACNSIELGQQHEPQAEPEVSLHVEREAALVLRKAKAA